MRPTTTLLSLALIMVFSLLNAGSALAEQPPAFRIIIDPGHGGKDAGATDGELNEKALTLAIATRIQKLAKNSPVEILLTRNTDEFVSLKDRTQLAEEAGASLLLSLHVNSAPKSGIRGVELYYSTENPTHTQSERYCKAAAQSFGEEGILPLNKIETANYVVLRTAACPSAILELGFLSNEEDRALLAREAFLDQLAQQVWEGILRYLEG